MIKRGLGMVGQLPPKRPVTEEDRDGILIPLASGIQELLFAPVNPFNDRAGFVAGPPPDTGLASAVQTLTRLNCRVWASSDKSGYSQRTNQYSAEVCGPYLDSLGENPTPGSIGPPFTGGQCYGVTYDFTFTFTNDQGVRASSEQSAARRIVGARTQANAQGTISVGYDRQSDPTAPIQFVSLSAVSPGTNANPVITNVRLRGGAPDNCGNPPTEVQPPATVTPVTPIVPTVTINLPGVGPITVNIELDPDGRPVICAPDVEKCITIAPEIGIGIGGDGGDGGDGGGGGGGAPPGDVGNPGAGGTAGPGGDAEGEAPPGSVLTGLKLNLVTIPPGAREYDPGVYRGVCYVYMGTPSGLDHDPVGAMVRSGQFAHAEKDNLTKWRVASNNGFVIDVVPYYREVPV